MADLGLVQVRTLVDETDIGKIRVGQQASVTVDAFPMRPFEGAVLKIEPQAQTEQNVTMFPVLVRIDNREGLLRPGMNSEVEIHVGQREEVLAVPNSALRTLRDVGSAAQVLGLSPERVRQDLAARRPGNRSALAASAGRSREGGSDGRAEGIDTARAVARRERPDASFGGRYIVFVKRAGAPQPVWIRTGLTDLDYSEVVDGLAANDSVLILPSASLVQEQQESQQRVNRITGGGGVPGMQQQAKPPGGARTEGR
jgi:HlyD family secretion protein